MTRTAWQGTVRARPSASSGLPVPWPWTCSSRSRERTGRPDAAGERALFLPRRGGGRLDVFTAITAHAGLDDATIAHAGRHPFVTPLIRGGEDLITVVALAGHARLETLKVYSHSTDEDEQGALRRLTVDR